MIPFCGSNGVVLVLVTMGSRLVLMQSLASIVLTDGTYEIANAWYATKQSINYGWVGNFTVKVLMYSLCALIYNIHYQRAKKKRAWVFFVSGFLVKLPYKYI